jgi:GNAT superfamily N-acetyltransferase
LPLVRDASRRAELSAAAAAMVDGLGAWRIVRAWEEILAGASNRGPGPVTVRPAIADDARLLWHWRNDPVTRASSRSHESIPLDRHVDWLRTTLERPDRRLLVGERGGEPVGTVRWDLRDHGEWEVSITVAPHARGTGLAGPLLRAAEEWLAQSSATPPGQDLSPPPGGELAAYLAVVHRDNDPSRRLFLSSGYLPDLPSDETGFERYVKWARSDPR